MTKYQKCIVVLMGIFFLFAAFMTYVSHQRYMGQLCEVELGTGYKGTIQLQRSLEIERKPHDYGLLTATWDLGNYNSQLHIGKEVLVCTDEQVYDGVVRKVVRDDQGVPTISVEVDWAYTPDETYWDVTLMTMITSVEYEHIFPITCLRDSDGNEQIAVVYERPKRWGMEYYVHFEDVNVYERNATECAIRDIPYGGEVIEKTERRLYEGMCVKVETDKMIE